MRSRLLLLAGTLFIALSTLALSASAQDVTVPLPGEYVAPDSASAPEQIPDPTLSLQDDGSTVAVPIPGGGEIQVEGPASEAAAGIGPIENWSTQRTNPSSVGTGPMGPITPPQ
jgi:hypothetical protein